MAVSQANHAVRLRHAALACLCFHGVAAAAGRVVDRPVAVVGSEVLTLTALDFEARVLLIFAGGSEAATAPLEHEDLRSALDSVVGQRLATSEADKLKAWPLEEGAVEQAMRVFRARFRTERDFDGFLERHEADAPQVAAVLERFLRTQRVFDGKFRLRAQPSEAEVRRAHAERSELRDATPAAVRQKLYQERFTELVAEELRALRRSSQVRLLGPFEGGARDGGAGP